MHAILRSRQKRQAITGLRRTLCLFEGNFNTPCPAFTLGIFIATCCDDIVSLFMRFTLTVPVPLSVVGNDGEGAVDLCALGRYNESVPGLDLNGGWGCLYA
jgi:hypothetical protein